MKPRTARAARLWCTTPQERSALLALLVTTLADLVWPNRPQAKPAGQRRRTADIPDEHRSGTGQRAAHRGTPDQCCSQRRASGGVSCSGSQQNPSVAAGHRQLGPRQPMSRAKTEPKATHRQREHHRLAAERTPSVLGAAQSGRQPFAAAAPTSIDDRPPASCHHPVPKSVPPSPTLHIRLIRSLHKFLQGRDAILWGPPYQRLPSPSAPLRYGLTRHHDNQLAKP